MKKSAAVLQRKYRRIVQKTSIAYDFSAFWTEKCLRDEKMDEMSEYRHFFFRVFFVFLRYIKQKEEK